MQVRARKRGVDCGRVVTRSYLLARPAMNGELVLRVPLSIKVVPLRPVAFIGPRSAAGAHPGGQASALGLVPVKSSNGIKSIDLPRHRNSTFVST